MQIDFSGEKERVNKNQFKIYVDEDSIEFGRHLNEEHNLNILFPKNLRKSISDEEQLRLANSQKAFILTKNKNDFLNISHVFDKIKEGGIIIWNNNQVDICHYVRHLCELRSLELKGKIYVVNNNGILIYSKEGKSSLKMNQPCELCHEKCKYREGHFLH